MSRGSLVRSGLLAALVALAAGCGDGASAPRGSTSSGGLDAASRFEADRDPWGEEPAGAAWDLCAWVPLDEGAEARAFDVAQVKAHRVPFRTSGMWFSAVEARRRWIRDLGLSEETLGDVVAVEEPVRFLAVAPRPAGPQVLERVKAAGWVEVPLEGGVRAFRAAEADYPIVAWIDGRLVFAEPEVLVRVGRVRSGGTRTLQDLVGAREVCAAVGPGLPVEVSAGTSMRRRRPSDPPAPEISMGRYRLGDSLSEVRVLRCATESDLQALRKMLDEMMRSTLDPDDPRPTLGIRGTMLRVTSDWAIARVSDPFGGAVRNDLSALTSALEQYRGRQGEYPKGPAGLAALASVPEALDDLLGVVPLDPWGRPYAYDPHHPKRPDGFVLRSLGPDGDLDTEDDLLPHE